jgi:predicted phosphoribosyltransferase
VSETLAADGNPERQVPHAPLSEPRETRRVALGDGVATGATTIACVRGVRAAGAARVVLAVPVGPSDTIERLREEADEVVCVETPPHFRAVGQFYASFDQVSDAEAKASLRGDGARDG